MAYKYARTGSPFNFLGNMSESQKEVFYSWLEKKSVNFTPIKEWYQIRAHQLRKTAGVLEEFYKTQRPKQNLEPLSPTFIKDAWQPGKDGHFSYVNREDGNPTITVSRIKDRFHSMLELDDEGVFWMNWLRNNIEKHEDKAQFALEAPAKVGTWKAELDKMFKEPLYQQVLVRDKSELYKGEPYYRVHPMDEPTIWEKEQFSHNKEGKIGHKMPIPDYVGG